MTKFTILITFRNIDLTKTPSEMAKFDSLFHISFYRKSKIKKSLT